MWEKQDIIRAAAAIIATLIGWGLIRLLFPIFDYFPPESLTLDLERSWVFNTGVRNAAGLVYLTVAMVLMAVFFKAVQQHAGQVRDLHRASKSGRGCGQDHEENG